MLKWSKQRLDACSDWDGVTVSYRKKDRMVFLSGWYEQYAGISGDEVSLGALLVGLGITLKDCEKAISEADQLILRAIVVELHAAIPAWAGKPTLAQLRTNILTRYRALSS